MQCKNKYKTVYVHLKPFPDDILFLLPDVFATLITISIINQ